MTKIGVVQPVSVSVGVMVLEDSMISSEVHNSVLRLTMILV